MQRLTVGQLRQELLGVLTQACPAISGDSWSPLTRTVLNWLRRRGRELGFVAWDSKGEGGYLWDVGWGSQPDARRYRLELVAEVELTDQNFDEICNDFYKVLDAKSRLKLFVCAPPSRAMVNRLREEIDLGRDAPGVSARDRAAGRGLTRI
jgi:hypothetical protein